MSAEWAGIGVAAIAIALSATLLGKPIRTGPSTDSPADPVERAFSEWQVGGLVRAALLEGAALVNTIFAVFMGGGLANLVPAVACIAALVVFFPTRDSWEQHRNARVAELGGDAGQGGAG